MKYKMIESNYTNYGKSEVIIRCKYGTFTGTAQLNHKDDEQYASRIFGCKIAEMRALKKAYLEKVKLLKRDAKTINNVIKNLPYGTPQFVIDSINADKNNIYKQIVQTKRYIGQIEDGIDRAADNRIIAIENMKNVKTAEQKQEEMSKKYKELLEKYNKVISN